MMDYFEKNISAAEERAPYLISQMEEFRANYWSGDQ